MSARPRLASPLLLLLLPRLLSTLSRSFFDTPCRASRIQTLTRLFQRSVKATTTGTTTTLTTTTRSSSKKNSKQQSSRRLFFFHHSFSKNSRSHQFSHRWKKKKKKKKKKNFAPPLKKKRRRRRQNFERRRTKKMEMKSKNLHLSASFVLTEKRHYLRAFIKRKSSSSRGVGLFVSSLTREKRVCLSFCVFSPTKKEFTTTGF